MRLINPSSLLESMKACRGEYSNVMPQYFAEEHLRIYTKKPEHFGLIQAGYRAILAQMQKTLNKEEDISSVNPAASVPTPPATEAPSTPRSRNASLPKGSGPSSTPFSINSFTTVDPNFVPLSPIQATRRASGQKRQREEATLAPVKRRK